MLKSLLDGVCAAAGAALFSVLPSFIQQYLAGLSAVQGYLTRRAAGGVALSDQDQAYRQWLAAAIEQIDGAGGFSRLFAFVRNFDGSVVRDVLATFEPGVQFTLDGLYFFALGIVVGLSVSWLLSLPFRFTAWRRRRRDWYA